MKLGILETGRVPPEMVADHGDYPTQFSALFQVIDPSMEVVAYHIEGGIFPEAPDTCDAWLITGSKHGVYDPEPWIEPFKEFLRAARAAGVPMIGICFGHQIMAEAFGGRAEKSVKGWGVGVHAYDVHNRPSWMADAGPRLEMHAMHQDQVTALPEDAAVLASSPFCENAMLSYGDPEQPDAISIQPHPEFAMPYARDLVALRRGDLIPEELAETAMATFGQSVANQAFAGWAIAYLRGALARKAAA